MRVCDTQTWASEKTVEKKAKLRFRQLFERNARETQTKKRNSKMQMQTIYPCNNCGKLFNTNNKYTQCYLCGDLFRRLDKKCHKQHI